MDGEKKEFKFNNVFKVNIDTSKKKRGLYKQYLEDLNKKGRLPSLDNIKGNEWVKRVHPDDIFNKDV